MILQTNQTPNLTRSATTLPLPNTLVPRVSIFAAIRSATATATIVLHKGAFAVTQFSAPTHYNFDCNLQKKKHPITITMFIANNRACNLYQK